MPGTHSAVGDICYLLRFVYITLYLESGMPRRGKPTAGHRMRLETPSPSLALPLPLLIPSPCVALCHCFTYFYYTCRQHFNMCLLRWAGQGWNMLVVWAWQVNRRNMMPEKVKQQCSAAGGGGGWLKYFKYIHVYIDQINQRHFFNCFAWYR